MALKDLKSDLSKFRRPVEKPLVDKKRVDVPKSTNQQPLSQFVDKTPSAPKSNTTTPKQGVTPTKFDNSSNYLGETNPTKFDNSSNYLGETTPTKMSLEERFLGQTETQEVQQGDKFKGETTTTDITQGDRFKGQTTPQDYSNVEKFKGETDPVEFKFTQQFLGETTPKDFSFTEQFLGETEQKDFILRNNFLGETDPNKFSFDPKFDLQAKDPKFVNFITDDDAKGFSPFQQPKNNSTFVGVDPSQTKFDGVTPISGQFVLNQYGVNPSNDGGLGATYTNEVLKTTYNKFNLREDSYNSSIFKQPFILRGIQRKKGEPQTIGVGSFSFIRGGAVTAVASALTDVVRMGKFLLSPRGITWSLKQTGLQRTQKYGTKFNPANLLLNIGGQHIGNRYPRTNGVADESFKYINRSDSDFLSTFSSTNDLEYFSTIRFNPNGGFDSFYGIGPSQESRVVNTFQNYESEGPKGGLPTIKDYELASYGKISKMAKRMDDKETSFNDFRTDDGSNQDFIDNNLDSRYSFPSYGPGPRASVPDAINFSEILEGSDFNSLESEVQDDLVTLWFSTLDTTYDLIQFRSTVTGITETFSPSWNAIKYTGRADKAYMYSEFERTLSFNFKVYATSKLDVAPMYKKLERLSTYTMPKYVGSRGYYGKTLSFRLGNLYNDHPAIITSLSYTYPDDLPWDISEEMPFGVDVSIGLTLLGTTRPEYRATDIFHYNTIQ